MTNDHVTFRLYWLLHCFVRSVRQLPAAVKPFFVVLMCDGTSDVNQPPVSVCIARGWVTKRSVLHVLRALAGAVNGCRQPCPLLPAARCQLIAFGCFFRGMTVFRDPCVKVASGDVMLSSVGSSAVAFSWKCVFEIIP